MVVPCTSCCPPPQSKLSKSEQRVSALRDAAERDDFSDAVVVYGVETGRANVTVKLIEPGYEHVASAMTELKVVERPDLKPGVVYIAPATQVQYELLRNTTGHEEVIAMPDNHYRWRTANDSVASIDNRMGLLSALAIGQTHVKVSDLRLSEDM